MYLIKNAKVFVNDELLKINVLIQDDHTIKLTTNDYPNISAIDASGKYLLPGLIDTHVHFREPGFEYRETIATGSLAAAKGGFTNAFMMPNLKPVMDNLNVYNQQLERIKKSSLINLYQIAAISIQEQGKKLVDIAQLAQKCHWFSDDGKGVQNPDLMKQAMEAVKNNNALITAHCEDESELLPHACINQNIKDQEYQLVGINNASEYNEVIRDLKLAAITKCRFHICHMSTKESVKALKEAKKTNPLVSGEVTVHHLLLNDEDITRNHGDFKANPPLRAKLDQQALIQGIKDHTIEVIATDHAPHSEKEKNTTFALANMGVVGVETAFALIYTKLVKPQIITLKDAIYLMSYNPARIFNIPNNKIVDGNLANITLFDFNVNEKIDPTTFVSKGKSTPFKNEIVNAKCLLTIVNGKIVYREEI